MKKYTEFLNEDIMAFLGNDVGGIRFGNPTKEQYEIELTTCPVKEWFLNTGLAAQIIKDAPLNNSSTTKKDLEVLVDKMSKITPEDLIFARAIEENLPQAFLDFLLGKGYETTMEEYFFIDRQTEPLLFHLKNNINRPRPNQLAYAYGIPLYPLVHTDANNASYPSGHALSGFVIGEYYARKYPEIAKDMRAFGQKVAEGRENVGIHYPSDTEVSRMISKVIWDNNLLRINNQ